MASRYLRTVTVSDARATFWLCLGFFVGEGFGRVVDPASRTRWIAMGLYAGIMIFSGLVYRQKRKAAKQEAARVVERLEETLAKDRF